MMKMKSSQIVSIPTARAFSAHAMDNLELALYASFLLCLIRLIRAIFAFLRTEPYLPPSQFRATNIAMSILGHFVPSLKYL